MLAALHIAWGALLMVAGAVVLVLFAFGGIASEDEQVMILLGSIAVVASAVLFVLSLAGIVSAVGLFKQQRWARYALMILGAIWMIKVPVGTALGIYTFYVLTRDEVVEMLK
jgi:hypothetical protein